MQAIQHSQFGQPEKVLQVKNINLPIPQAGQVRVKTLLASIHHHDLWIVRGEYGIKPKLPSTAGSEAVGIVDAVGEGVDSTLIGQRVNATGSGTWSEYFITTADRLIKIPDNISDEDAAQIGLMPLSAQVLLNFIGIQAGQWMIQNTANGAVGKALALFAQRQGISVINLVRRAEAVNELSALSIKHIVNISDSNWQQQVKTITQEPIIAAVDSIGGSHTRDLFNLLSEGGQLVIFGSLTNEPMTLSSADIIFKRATIRGFWGATAFQSINDARQMMIQNIIDAISKKELALPIDEIYTFSQIRSAIEATLTKGKNGKVLLRP